MTAPEHVENYTLFGRPIGEASVRDLLEGYRRITDRVHADPRDEVQRRMLAALIAEVEQRCGLPPAVAAEPPRVTCAGCALPRPECTCPSYTSPSAYERNPR